jgi:ketosteroid isomerase-like protein
MQENQAMTYLLGRNQVAVGLFPVLRGAMKNLFRSGVVMAAALGVILLVTGAGCSGPPQALLPSAEIIAIREADQAYATAWLTNDQGRVMGTLTGNAVIVPSGIPAIEGSRGIREFWWPAVSPPASVIEFNLNQLEVGGSGEFGFVRGTFTLVFDFDGKRNSNQGDYLSLLRRLPGGEWRITHRLWNDHPVEEE